MVLKTAFESRNEDFFCLARKPTDAYFYRLMGGFRNPDGKKTVHAKMGFENRPQVIFKSFVFVRVYVVDKSSGPEPPVTLFLLLEPE